MPKDITTNVQLAKHIRIPYFRSIFMRTTLLTGGVYQNESSIIWITRYSLGGVREAGRSYCLL